MKRGGMKKNKYLLIISLMNCSLFAMENPVEIPAQQPGIFLKQIVSEYKNPIRVSLMPIQRSISRRHEFEIADDLYNERTEPLAVVFNNQVQFCKREIKTEMESVSSFKELHGTVFEIACLRIEDLLKRGTAGIIYIWLHKYLKNHRNVDNNQRGHLATNFDRIEEFDFDPIRPSQTLITMKLNHKDRFDSRRIEVQSKTTPDLDLKYDYSPAAGGPL
jgi:hypothetical protein